MANALPPLMAEVADEEEERRAVPMQTCLLWRRFNKESRDCEIAWSYCSAHFTGSVRLTPGLPPAPSGCNNNPTTQIAWTEMFVLP